MNTDSTPASAADPKRPDGPLAPHAPDDADIEAALFELLGRRAAGATICPSDVARALAPDEPAWRALMPRVRSVAARLQAIGRLQATQRGEAVDPSTARGAIRLGRPGSLR